MNKILNLEVTEDVNHGEISKKLAILLLRKYFKNNANELHISPRPISKENKEKEDQKITNLGLRNYRPRQSHDVSYFVGEEKHDLVSPPEHLVLSFFHIFKEYSKIPYDTKEIEKKGVLNVNYEGKIYPLEICFKSDKQFTQEELIIRKVNSLEKIVN